MVWDRDLRGALSTCMRHKLMVGKAIEEEKGREGRQFSLPRYLEQVGELVFVY